MSMLALALTFTTVYGQANEFSGPFPKAPEFKREPVRARWAIFSRHRERSVKVKKQNVRHSAQYEFYERVERAAHNRKILLRQLAKPQYSNFLYFGHKHKPRRRPPNKMRYCEECGIRH